MKHRCRSEADCGLFPAGYHRGRLGRPLSFVKFEVPQQQLASGQDYALFVRSGPFRRFLRPPLESEQTLKEDDL